MQPRCDGSPPPEAILIETSGHANPAHIVETLFYDPSLRRIVRLNAVVAVVDASQAATMQHALAHDPNHTVFGCAYVCYVCCLCFYTQLVRAFVRCASSLSSSSPPSSHPILLHKRLFAKLHWQTAYCSTIATWQSTTMYKPWLLTSVCCVAPTPPLYIVMPVACLRPTMCSTWMHMQWIVWHRHCNMVMVHSMKLWRSCLCNAWSSRYGVGMYQPIMGVDNGDCMYVVACTVSAHRK